MKNVDQLREKIVELTGKLHPLGIQDKEASLPVARELLNIADECRISGAPFLGVAAYEACHRCFYGTDEMGKVWQFYIKLLADVINCATNPPLMRIAACTMLISELRLEPAYTKLRRDIEAIRRAIMMEYAKENNAKSVLVTGFILRTNYGDEFEFQEASYHVTPGSFSFSSCTVTMTVESVFHSLIDAAQFDEADRLASEYPDAFVYPWEKAWAWVARAHVVISPNEMRDAFIKAAGSFEKDAAEPAPEELQKRGGWSSINIETWAPYYRGRAALLDATLNPDNALDYIRQADELLGKFLRESGWYVPLAIKTAHVVKGLLNFFETKNPETLTVALNAIQREVSFGGKDQYDPVFVTALNKIREAFIETEKDPRRAFTDGHVIHALNILDASPIASPASALKAVSPLVAGMIFDKSRETEAERRLKAIGIVEAITDESVFRKLLRELLQGLCGIYTKITHGPIERGRDVIAVLNEGITQRIWMFQAKAGKISKKNLRDLKDQVEAMFNTRIDDSHIPNELGLPKRGIVVHTDPTTTHIDAEFLGWIESQRKAHSWDIEIWEPEGLVDWIIKNNLDGVLRLFAAREGIRSGK